MALLPKSRSDFSSKDYWETFFKKRGNKAFEWYGEYSSHCGLLAKYVKIKDVILEIGCGNSELAGQMYDFGYKNITCIDISSKAIQQMKQKHLRTRPDLKFLEMDIFNTTFCEGQFSVVLDKGTLDAIYSEDTPENDQKVSRMFEEVARLLKVGGRYLCFSLAQSFIAHKIINFFTQLGWLVRVCLIPTDTDTDFYMPVFMFVLTKFKKMPSSKPILETAFLEEKVERLDTPDDVIKSIEDVQNYALVRQNISSKKVEEELCVHLYSSSSIPQSSSSTPQSSSSTPQSSSSLSSSSPRYTIYIVEAGMSTIKKFAIFIVPQGRELEWMFSTTDGRLQLHKSCGYERLLVVLLSRFHHYGDIDAVKEELSSKVLDLAPPNVGKQSPFLTLGNSTSVRTIREEGVSELSGGYVVEDVSVDENVFRRLVFFSMPDNIQSEVLLTKSVKRGARKGSRVETLEVDHSHLNTHYCKSIVASLVFVAERLKKGGELKMAMLGLGGGTLSMYLLKAFPNLKIEAVELDEKVVEVARKWFGLGGGGMEGEDGRLKVVVDDAVKFVEEAKKEGKSYDIVVLDIDNKDPQTGFSFPPKHFLEAPLIQSYSDIISPSGVFVLNLVTRVLKNRKMVVERLKECFGEVWSRKVSDEVNEVCYCIKGKAAGVEEEDGGGDAGDNIDLKIQNLEMKDAKGLIGNGEECLKTLIRAHDKKYLQAVMDVDFKTIKSI